MGGALPVKPVGARGGMLPAGPQGLIIDHAGDEGSDEHGRRATDAAARGRDIAPSMVVAAEVRSSHLTRTRNHAYERIDRVASREGMQVLSNIRVLVSEQTGRRQAPGAFFADKDARDVRQLCAASRRIGATAIAARLGVMADLLGVAALNLAGEHDEQAVTGRGRVQEVAGVDLELPAHGPTTARAVWPGLVALEVWRAAQVRATAAAAQFQGGVDKIVPALKPEEGRGGVQWAHGVEQGALGGEFWRNDTQRGGLCEGREVVECRDEVVDPAARRVGQGLAKAMQRETYDRDGVGVDIEVCEQVTQIEFDAVAALRSAVLVEDYDETVQSLGTGMKDGESGVGVDAPVTVGCEECARAGVAAVDVAAQVDRVLLGVDIAALGRPSPDKPRQVKRLP